MTLKTEILSTETSDFLKQIIILKSFNPIALRKAKIECNKVNSVFDSFSTHCLQIRKAPFLCVTEALE